MAGSFNPKNWNNLPDFPKLPPFPSPDSKTPPPATPPKQPPLPIPPKNNTPSNPLDDLLGPDKKPDSKPPENKPEDSDKPKPAEEAINPKLFDEGKKLADGFFKDPSKLQDQFKGFQKRLGEMKTPEEKGILIKGFMTALEASLKENKPA